MSGEPKDCFSSRLIDEHERNPFKRRNVTITDPPDSPSPNTKSPANVDAANEWNDNRDEFKRKVSQCVRDSQERKYRVIKSSNDHREYRVIKLTNGLEALLVHDPHIINTKESSYNKRYNMPAAVSMTVQVGYLDSPKNVQGLAHLLEHMLLKKSKHFPENKGYNQYIEEHGGSANAFTDAEHSSYYFEINGLFLEGALERFADGFSHPIFTKDILKAEVKAIDSEFWENKGCIEQFLPCFQCYSAKQNHPFNNIFSAGNEKSLMGEKMRCIDLCKEVSNFYQGKYKGNIMKLVVIGGESLLVLQGWVEKLFKSIKKRRSKNVVFPKCLYLKSLNQISARRKHLPSKNKIRSLSKTKSIWNAGIMYHIDHFKNENLLKLSWTLPCLRNQYQYHPEIYLSSLFNHCDKGNLWSYLKNRGWAVYVISKVEPGICMTSTGYVFVITVTLTDSGLLEVNTIIDLIYQYLNLFRASQPKWIFEENRRIGEMTFNIGVEESQILYANRLSENLLFFKAKDVIFADYWCQKWDENIIKQILHYFVPANMRVDVISSTFKEEVTGHEPWYGTGFSIHNIDENYMKSWGTTEEVPELLGFPIKNPYIFWEDFVGIGEKGDYLADPKLILDEKMVEFWYKKDYISTIPRVAIRIDIDFRSTSDNVRNSALSELFVDIVVDSVIDLIYKARSAMIDTELKFSGGIIQLEVVGFIESIPSLLSHILSKINSFMPSDDFRFKLLRNDMWRDFMEEDEDILEPLLLKYAYDRSKKASYLSDDLSLNEMKEFIQEMRSQVFIKGLCIGNVQEDYANNICDVIKTIFQQNILPSSLRHVEKVINLPPNQNSAITFVRDGATQVQLYIQIGDNLFETPMLVALLELYAIIVHNHFFDDLRNQQNLAYSVECSVNLKHNVWGLEFYILTPHHNSHQIQRIIQKYMDDLEEFLEKLENEVIQDCIISLAGTLSKNLSLKEETNILWGEIIKYRCNFNFRQKILTALELIEKKDLIEFHRKYFKKSSTMSKRLWVCVNEEEDDYIDEEEDDCVNEEDDVYVDEEEDDYVDEEDDDFVQVNPKSDFNYYT